MKNSPDISLVYLIPDNCGQPQTTEEVNRIESLLNKFIGTKLEKFNTFVIKGDAKPGMLLSKP
jgi:hypothetical protein